jgi:hypothetical protein
MYSTLKGCLVTNLIGRNIINVLTSLVLGLFLVNEIQTPGLDLTVNEGTSKSSHDLLGLLVALGAAYV